MPDFSFYHHFVQNWLHEAKTGCLNIFFSKSHNLQWVLVGLRWDDWNPWQFLSEQFSIVTLQVPPLSVGVVTQNHTGTATGLVTNKIFCCLLFYKMQNVIIYQEKASRKKMYEWPNLIPECTASKTSWWDISPVNHKSRWNQVRYAFTI